MKFFVFWWMLSLKLLKAIINDILSLPQGLGEGQ